MSPSCRYCEVPEERIIEHGGESKFRRELGRYPEFPQNSKIFSRRWSGLIATAALVIACAEVAITEAPMAAERCPCYNEVQIVGSVFGCSPNPGHGAATFAPKADAKSELFCTRVNVFDGWLFTSLDTPQVGDGRRCRVFVAREGVRVTRIIEVGGLSQEGIGACESELLDAACTLGISGC